MSLAAAQQMPSSQEFLRILALLCQGRDAEQGELEGQARTTKSVLGGRCLPLPRRSHARGFCPSDLSSYAALCC